MNIYLSGIALIRKVKIVLLIQVFTIKSPICNWRYWDTTRKIFLSLVSQYSKGRIPTVWPSPNGDLQHKSQYFILVYASKIYLILTTYTSLNSERFCNNNSKLIRIGQMAQDHTLFGSIIGRFLMRYSVTAIWSSISTVPSRCHISNFLKMKY